MQEADGSANIVNTIGASTQLTIPDAPLMTTDVSEHAYFIDYRDAHTKFLNASRVS